MTPVRQQVLRLLSEISELNPDVRLGQLVANLSYLCAGSRMKRFGKWKTTSCSRRLRSI